jgi:hypothetical protein
VPKLNFMTQGRQLSTYPTSISHEQTQTCFGRSIFGCCIYVVLLLYTPIYTRHTHCTVFLSEMSSLSVCVRVCRDKCDSVIYVVLDGGCSCCCTGAEKRTRQKGWTIFLFVGAVEEEDCTDDEKNGSLLLLSQPSRRHLLQTGRRRRFLSS